MKRVITLMLLYILAACSAPEPPLRVGLLDWPPYGFAYVAEELGYFGNSNIQFVEFQSPAEATRAYVAGGIDIVALTMDYVVDLADKNTDNRAFLIIDESLGGDAVISREPMEHLSDIAGKRVGLESSELGAHMLSRLLDKASLGMSDVEVVFLDIPDQQEAYIAGEVDVVITYEPVRTSLLEAGGHQIFSSADIPGEIIDVFIARDSLILKRQAEFRTFTEGWFRTLELYDEDSEFVTQMLSSRILLTPQQAGSMLQGVRLIPRKENYRLLRGDNEDFVSAVGRFLTSAVLAEDESLRDSLADLFTDHALPAEVK